ncbi:hypothetical protein AbraIFM66950_009405 [Aspergillus brasiliensis]|nr:hypothetical protein AbraIFM66950_009405 [Aspergillus brasiliensis]
MDGHTVPLGVGLAVLGVAEEEAGVGEGAGVAEGEEDGDLKNNWARVVLEDKRIYKWGAG